MENKINNLRTTTGGITDIIIIFLAGLFYIGVSSIAFIGVLYSLVCYTAPMAAELVQNGGSPLRWVCCAIGIPGTVVLLRILGWVLEAAIERVREIAVNVKENN
jgi:hypothetical protein